MWLGGNLVVTSHQASVFLYLEGKQVALANWVIWEDGRRLWLRRHTFQIYVQMWLLLASDVPAAWAPPVNTGQHRHEQLEDSRESG